MTQPAEQAPENLPSHYKTRDGRIVAANAYLHKYPAELGLTPWPQGHGTAKPKKGEQTIHSTNEFDPPPAPPVSRVSAAAPAPRAKPGPKPKVKATTDGSGADGGEPGSQDSQPNIGG